MIVMMDDGDDGVMLDDGDDGVILDASNDNYNGDDNDRVNDI